MVDKNSEFSITFCGAAGEVTGSRHLIKTGGLLLLLDCGMFQGHRVESIEKNKKFLFKPGDIDAILLSHGHIDHCGALPMIYRREGNPPVYCTPATKEICSIMLMDSARLQEADAKFFNKIHARKSIKIEPLYEEKDAHAAIENLKSAEYNETLIFNETVSARFLDAGHVLGSSMIQIDARTSAGTRRLLYTGDLGRRKSLLMNPPSPPPGADWLVIESTYGSRIHDSAEDARNRLFEIIKRAVREKGKILIPSFALERTQEIIFVLDNLRHRSDFPDIPIYLDSPMAVSITKIFNRYSRSPCFDAEFRKYAEIDNDPFGFEYVKFVHSKEESQSLNDRPGSMIIISASGMLEGGRVLHHLRNNIANENTTVLLVGYQAEGALGRRLQDGVKKVKIFGIEHEVFCRVETLNVFSSHADKEDIIAFITGLNPAPKKIFLVHGDNHSRSALTEELKSRGFQNIMLPELGQTYNLIE
ncbi:MAG: MBL fold metallo-hydrolase [Elusimicrobia bacterium]|nr:MBL fold metallo-hydrolase [Elusimicrobiota bacterium]